MRVARRAHFVVPENNCMSSHASVNSSSVIVASALLLCTTAPALAQQAPRDSTNPDTLSSIDTIIVTGTRDSSRTQFEALTPIDVFSQDAIQSSVSNELVDTLAQLVPSFNVQRLPSADGSQFVRPARLRGLSPDHTLVLINGKRFHRAAFIGGSGAQGPDLAQIPSFAIKRIEVLRDGVSAQYGSDAIAGVINIILEDRPDFDAFTQYSTYYEGDGENAQAGARGGFELGDGGYLVATAEWSDSDMTSRTRQRPDAIQFQNAHPELDVPDPVQHWGQPELRTLRLAVNSVLPLTSASDAYLFGTFTDGHGVNDFNWRNPDTTANAYGRSNAFPQFDLRSLYPLGFSPRFGQDDQDTQAVAGVRGSFGEALRWDLSASWGRNRIEYFIDETINASLGPQSPTSFQPGALGQDELNLNADFVYEWQVGPLADAVNIAFGLERRVETYDVEAGDPASYAVGPGAASGLASGSNGFPGYSPDQAGSWDQTSYAVYGDVEIPLTQRWTLGSALRFEDYSEFGSKTTGKLSTRFELLPGLALRGAYSTGFRAPTPGQLNSTRTSQGLDTTTLQIFTTGRLSPLSPVSQFFGAKPLQPEESSTLTVGLTWQTDFGLSGSADAYHIEVENRFSQSPTYSVTPAIRQQLIAAGIPGAEVFTGVGFFTNDYDTRTRGFDIVAAYTRALGGGRIELTGAYNHNSTEVTAGSFAASATQSRLFEESIPQQNLTGSASYSIGPLTLSARMRYYGSWTDASGNTTGDIIQEFGALTLFDALLDYRMTDSVTLRIGAENLFDEYPDEATFQANRGLIYSRNAPYDTDGGLYYVRMSTQF
jgi:iron complex outermembrane recepter protein